ncbi:prominin-1-A-like isoform X2 [Convolutriloba macropyga]|uniref:prominin-1-A-like isoform X2 n=1 Tax=Convolutriloba macropyga TaxID=536237 RepID=UPI003F527BAE
MYRSISSSIFTFITIYGIIYLASAQDSSAKSGDATSKNYVISADGENITFTPFAEDDYITKSPEEKCFLLRYIDDAIYEMLQYVNFKKDPPYGKDIYDLMRKAIAGNVTFSDIWQSKEYQDTLVDSQLGFAMCVGVAILLAILVPLIGLIIFICRCCCNKCRAKYELPKNDQESVNGGSSGCDNCARRFFTMWLIIFVLLLLLCGLMLLWVNFDLGSSTENLQTSLDNGKKDLKTYSKNVKKGLEYAITKQLLSLKDAVYTKNLNNTQKTLGVMIQDKIIEQNPKFAEANGTLSTLNNQMQALLDLYSDTDLKSEQAVHLQEILLADLKTLMGDINETKKECKEKCDDIPVTHANMYPPSDDFDANFKQLDALLQLEADIQSLVIMSKFQFDSILSDTESQTLDQKREVLELFDDALADTHVNCYNEVVEKVSNISNLIPGKTSDYDDLISNDTYRGYAGYGVACFLLFLVLLLTLSVCCGICGYDEEATPAQRTNISHCGGLTLVLTTALLFLSFALLTLLGVSGFLSGGNFKLMICQDMSYSFIENVVDVPNTIPNFQGNFAATVLYGQPDNNEVKLGKLIKNCSEKDGSVSTGLRYDEFLETPILKCLQYKRELGRKLNNEINRTEVSIKTDKLLPSSQKVDDVTKDYSSLLQDVLSEAKGFKTRLEGGQIESYSLSELSYKLNKFADDLVSDTATDKTIDTDERLSLMKAQLELQQAAKQMESINLQYLEQLKQTRQDMIDQLGLLIDKIEKIQTGEKMSLTEGSDESYDISSGAVKDLVKEATGVLKYNSGKPWPKAPWDEAVVVYRKRLRGFVNEYGEYLFFEVEKNVGHCRPLHDIHSAIYDATCNQVLADYNQFWFFLLIASLTLLPLMFLALKLSNHYRILEPEDTDSFDQRFQAEGVPLKTVEPIAIDELDPENNANSPTRVSTNPRTASKPSPTAKSNSPTQPKFELNLRSSQTYQPPPPPNNPPSSRPSSHSPQQSQATTPSVGYSPVGNESAYESMDIGKRGHSMNSGGSGYAPIVGYQPMRTSTDNPVKQTNIC